MDQPVQFGITNFGYSFGTDQNVEHLAKSYVSDPERVVRWGYHTFHRAPDGMTATALCAAAAHEALAGANLDAADTDLVVVANSEVPEYLHWDSSAALARELKLADKQTLLLTEGCASGVTGLATVAGMMRLQPELQTVLFVAVNRVSEYHRNRMTVNNAVHSDSAVAVILRRNHPRLRWLSNDQFTVPDLCDFFRTDYGGSAAPVPPAGWSSATAPMGHVRVQAHFNKDPERLREFGEQVVQRLVRVIDGACRRAGVARSDIDHLIYLNDPDGIDDLIGVLGLPRERTNWELARSHSHMGASDHLVALGQHLERGELNDGDLVALTGISIGMRWYCTLIQV
jgi:3-oxoacyl-[acyl-carrier-protein] synthase-3